MEESSFTNLRKCDIATGSLMVSVNVIFPPAGRRLAWLDQLFGSPMQVILPLAAAPIGPAPPAILAGRRLAWFGQIPPAQCVMG